MSGLMKGIVNEGIGGDFGYSMRPPEVASSAEANQDEVGAPGKINRWGPSKILLLVDIYICYLDIYLYNIQKVVKTHNIT